MKKTGNAPQNILNFLSAAHASFLHARGKAATQWLMDAIKCEKNERVLEIGYGTGGTIVALAQKYKETHFYGVDTSKEMYQKATQRVKFCGLTHSISLINTPQSSKKLPFDSNFFNKIYIESVLGIQSAEGIHHLLLEIHRMLHPNGLLFVNETLWLDGVSPSEIERQNQYCLENFGIIQASAEYPHIDNWTSLLSSLGFKVRSIQWLNELPPTRFPQFFPYNLSLWRSYLFSAMGSLKTRLHPVLASQRKEFTRRMAQQSSSQTPCMEGVFIIAEKTP